MVQSLPAPTQPPPTRPALTLAPTSTRDLPPPPSQFLLPDSELVNSPCGREVDVAAFVRAAGGFLSTYTEEVEQRRLTGAEIVRRVAEDASVNPRALLAFIEFRSHWVSTVPPQPDLVSPLGFTIPDHQGLYAELVIAADLLNSGYYAWRTGSLTTLTFFDNRSAPIQSDLNAGTVALQYLFARMFPAARWEAELYGQAGFRAVYWALFGDPLTCAQAVEPLFAEGIQSPTLELPFAAGEAWSFTGGLHSDWGAGTPLGALDFAPVTAETPCAVSRSWVRAPAAGLVIQADHGVVQLALLGPDGSPTGWELRLMHIAQFERAAVGARLRTGDPVGHPSCEGGLATGTHVHLARMYRGEWIGAGGPFPYVLSGWLAVPGPRPYQSTLVKGEQVITSDSGGSHKALIIR